MKCQASSKNISKNCFAAVVLFPHSQQVQRARFFLAAALQIGLPLKCSFVPVSGPILMANSLKFSVGKLKELLRATFQF